MMQKRNKKNHEKRAIGKTNKTTNIKNKTNKDTLCNVTVLKLEAEIYSGKLDWKTELLHCNYEVYQ